MKSEEELEQQPEFNVISDGACSWMRFSHPIQQTSTDANSERRKQNKEESKGNNDQNKQQTRTNGACLQPEIGAGSRTQKRSNREHDLI